MVGKGQGRGERRFYPVGESVVAGWFFYAQGLEWMTGPKFLASAEAVAWNKEALQRQGFLKGRVRSSRLPSLLQMS